MMSPYFDYEVARGWIGLELQNGYIVAALKGVGAHMAVFAIKKEGHDDLVVKIPKSHMGFVIGMPPPNAFRSALPQVVLQTKQIQVVTSVASSGAEDVLLRRLLSLVGSPHLSHIWPLDAVWNRVAVELLKAHRPSRMPSRRLFRRRQQQKISSELQRYDALLSSKFVEERLVQWSTLKSREPLDYVTIWVVHPQGKEPIYAGIRDLVALDARSAISFLESVTNAHIAKPAVCSVDSNPLIPFIAAASSGYRLPTPSVSAVARLLADVDEMSGVMRQVGQALGAVTPMLDRWKKEQIMEFIMEIAGLVPRFGLDELFLCMQEIENAIKG